MKRRRLLMLVGSLCVIVTLLMSVPAFMQPATAAPIVLRGITPWVANFDVCKAFFIFQELVNKRAKGELTITYLGADEVVPALDQFEALRNGMVDVLLDAAAYYRGQVPEAACIQLTKLPPSQLRKSGFYDAMRKIHLERANVIYLANTSGVNKYRLYSNTKLTKPDFTGLKFRVSPVYIELIKALHGVPIMIQPAEVYTALERGVVQGYGWTLLGIMDFGWQEKTKYVLDHPFYALDVSILINANVWNKLPQHLRTLLEQVAIEVEASTEEYIAGRLAKEDKKLRDAGLQFIKFSPADTQYFLKTAYDVGWKDFNKQFPELGPKLRKLGGD